MPAKLFLALLLHFLILHPRMVGYHLDEATLDRLRLHEEQLNRELTWLPQELQQRSQAPVTLERMTRRQTPAAWGVLLAVLLQQFSFWVIIAILLLPIRYRRHDPDAASNEEESSDASSGEDEDGADEDAGDRRPPVRLSAKRILIKVENQDFRRQVVEQLHSF